MQVGGDDRHEPQPIEAGDGLPKGEDFRGRYETQVKAFGLACSVAAVAELFLFGWWAFLRIFGVALMAQALGVSLVRLRLARSGFNHDLDRGIGVISAWSGVVYRYYENGLALDAATLGHATTPDPGPRKEAP